MLTEENLREALRAAGIEAPPRFDEVTESTNRTALALAEAGAPEWTVVAAGHQTAGRGRLGRTWVSRPGAAVQFSVVLRPSSLEPERMGFQARCPGFRWGYTRTYLVWRLRIGVQAARIFTGQAKIFRRLRLISC